MNPCIDAAEAVAIRHGVCPDRRDILQDGHTLVVRLTESLVARIVTDRSGPRQGTAWFARETAIAAHLTQHAAPVIPLHPDLPPIAHWENGYPINFWQFVTITPQTPPPDAIGATLHRCHRILEFFPDPLPHLAILQESQTLLESLEKQHSFPAPTISLLRHHLKASVDALAPLPRQALHGDAHMGNLVMTATGLLWADWEDAFSGPVEWDLASVIWNARLLENDQTTADTILASYQEAGGHCNEAALHQCLVARAAVMSTWYPVLYPNPSAERSKKLQHRLDWLKKMAATAFG